MDIRIGNDICLFVKESELSNLGEINKISASFINMSPLPTHQCHESFPHSCLSSEYTIHGCGMPMYNVAPACGHHAMHRDPQNRGFCVYCDEGELRKDGDKFLFYFPALKQKFTGLYKVVLQVESVKDGLPHLATIDFGVRFKLSKNSGVTYCELELKKDVKHNLFIEIMDDQQIANLNKNYMHVITNNPGCVLEDLQLDKIVVNFPHGEKRLVLITNTPKLYVGYEIFQFPMKLYKLNDVYIYVSEYLYSDVEHLELTLIKTDVNKYPVVILPGASEDIPDTPDTPDTPEEPEVKPELSNNTINFANAILNDGLLTINNDGVLSNSNLILT